MNKEKSKKEFSKILSIIVITLFIIVLFYSMALMWKTNMTDGLMYLIPSVATLASVTTGFYFWKSKMENMIKLSKENNMSINELKNIESNIDMFETELESEDY